MPRDVPLGNGNLLVNFDASFQLRDLYFPYVGQENHTGAGKSRFGVWVDQHFSWVHDAEWHRTLRYEPETLVSRVTLRNARLGLHLQVTDAVDATADVMVRRVEVTDFFDRPRQVRLFFHFDAHMWGHNIGDSVYYDPRRRALIHYKGRRYILLNSATAEGTGFASYATGTKGIHGAEGTWRDAEDGRLSGHPVAQGSIDSVGSCALRLEPNGSNVAYFWIAAGLSAEEVHRLDDHVRRRSPEGILRRTRDYWHHWVQRSNQQLDALPDDVRRLYLRSFLILRTQIDNRGAILAANDGDTLQFGRDTYCYVWPRDGALVSDALIRSGYSEVSQRFFTFCFDAINDEGYLLHKYNPDGSLGSSWHPWVDAHGQEELPIQEDETALVLWALWSHYNAFHDLEFVRPLYDRLIHQPAEFLLHYRDPATGLPLPSHDVWEERRGVHLYTAAAVWAGLRAASAFAKLFGDIDMAMRADEGADQISAAMRSEMVNEDGRFVRRLFLGPDGTLLQDQTVDASMAGCFLFDTFAPDCPEVVRTMQAVEEKLWCRRGIGGVARYEHDYYCRQTDEAPGNPWIICTMWLAKWYMAMGRTVADLDRPLELLKWATDRALESGVLAEQFHPLDGSPQSVAPLTWSHASFITAVLDYVTRRAELEADDSLAAQAELAAIARLGTTADSAAHPNPDEETPSLVGATASRTPRTRRQRRNVPAS